jgi:hypothetical protein
MGIVQDLRQIEPGVRQTMNGYNADIIKEAALYIEKLTQQLTDAETVTPAPLPENMAFNFDALDTPETAEVQADDE